jgi:hypothetical protein
VLFLISGGFSSSLHHWLVASLFLCFRAKLKQFSFSFEKLKKFPLWVVFFFFPNEKDNCGIFFHVILRVGCWKWVAEWDNKINGLQFGESEDRAQWR